MKGRIRTHKPEFFQHGDLYDLEEASGPPGQRLPLRLAFLGLWNWTDRAQRFEWKPRELKLNILPYDPVDFAEILAHLERGGFVVRYEVAGKSYGLIPTFLRHQRIDHKEAQSDLPEPPADVLRAIEQGLVAGGFHVYRTGEGNPMFPEVVVGLPAEPESIGSVKSGTNSEPEPNSAASSDVAGELPGVPEEKPGPAEGEGNRIEGKGTEPIDTTTSSFPLVSSGNGRTPTRPLPAIVGKRTGEAVIVRIQAVVAEIAEGARTQLSRQQETELKAEMVFAYWQAIHNHPRAILDEPRERRICRQLKQNGGDVSELFYTVDGARKDPAIQGEMKDANGKYDGIETIFRDRGQVERLANLMTGYRKGEPHRMAEKYRQAFGNEPAKKPGETTEPPPAEAAQ